MTTKKFTPSVTRGPRLNPGEIAITPPEDLGVDVPASGLQKAMPYVMGVCMLGMIAIMVMSGTKQLSPYMMMTPLMMIMMSLSMVGAGGGGGGKKVPEINADRKEYLRYLAGLRPRVTSSATAQVAFFSYHAPHPEDLLSIIGTPRQWSRPASADFYAATRIGIGDQPAVDRLMKPSAGGELAGPSAAPQPYLEPVANMWAVKFLRTHGLIHDCPKLLQLRTFPTIAVGGDLAGAAGLLTAIICHLAVFHPPDLLAIRVLTEAPDDPEWSWLKWLPHVQHPTDTDAAGAVRMISAHPESLSDLAARGPHTPDSTPGGPYIVVVDLTGGKAGVPPDGRAGVTLITLGNHRGSNYRIRVAEDGTADDRLPGQSFRQVTSSADRMSTQQATRVARKLAGWSVTGGIIDKKSSGVKRKVATEWHQLVGAKSVEEVTPARWRMFADKDLDRLKIPFGHQLKTGEVMYLDIKEGAEFGGGPHGMLIGTTGSGKSEFLRTLILSLVAMHHPDQVNLLLTDFKGGSTFLGMEKLPHTAAVITNMAEEAELVGRMGEVLTGELDRRQNLLRQAGIQVGATGALSGVAEYEKYRERGADLKPLPTLFVVVDEFAELLQSHPDFVGLFDRICRVGRSLRVHLLLATQSLQTGGARIDKLEPNLTYRIALRTTSSHESKSVIGTPEAQYITNKESGVGFLRVGMEDPIKFSTLYTGATYVPPVHVESNGEASVDGSRNSAQALQIRRFIAAPMLDEVGAPPACGGERRS
jgi:type VII secretion protein EccCa